jgi:hypothetical protein
MQVNVAHREELDGPGRTDMRLPRVCSVVLNLLIALGRFAPAIAQSAAPTPWPHTITKDNASVTVYQPQAISWTDQKTLTARVALAITPAGAKAPILGTIEVALATTTDATSRIVTLSDPSLVASHFPSLNTDQASALEQKIRVALPDMQIHQVPLDSVLLSLKQIPVSSVELNNDPPTIFYSDRPADGDPVLAPVGKTGLSFVVNTNWEVFVDRGAWYLLNNGLWLSATAAAAPYAPVTRLPAAFSELPNDASFADAKKHVPARPLAAGSQVPTIFVSTKPAEIIVTAGPPKLEPVPGTSLQRAANTPGALFFDPAQKLFYVLFSGRWFSAASLDGPWSFATDKLPPDFAMIPSSEPSSAVLASVPGTVQAQEAVLKASIPTTATLKRSSATLTVVYAGPPSSRPFPARRSSMPSIPPTRC